MHTLRGAPLASPLHREYSIVVIVSDIATDDGQTIPAGSLGTIVGVYGVGAAYEVEFVRPVVGNATVRAELLRPA